MTKSDLCKAANVSPSTIDRAVANQELPPPTYPVVNGKSTANFDDAAALNYIEHRKTLAKPSEALAVSRNGNGDAAMMRQNGVSGAGVSVLVEAIAAAVSDALQSHAKAPVMNLDQKMVLSLREAARVTGIPPRRLIDAWNRGELKGFKNHLRIGRGYRFRRTDLQRYVRTFGQD